MSPNSDSMACVFCTVKGRTKPSILRAWVGWLRRECEDVRGRASLDLVAAGVGAGSLPVEGAAAEPEPPSPLPLQDKGWKLQHAAAKALPDFGWALVCRLRRLPGQTPLTNTSPPSQPYASTPVLPITCMSYSLTLCCTRQQKASGVV